MALIDIKDVLSAAESEIREELVAKYKTQLKAAMREVHAAELILAQAKVKLDDIKARLAEGTLPGG